MELIIKQASDKLEEKGIDMVNWLLVTRQILKPVTNKFKCVLVSEKS